MRDSENPFVLLARITVKEGMVDAYLEIAEEVDRAVENTEEGMLLHTFDRDPDDPHKFVWTEVYRKSDDFLFHADNPPVLEYVEKHAELATHFSIEIYGNVDERNRVQALEEMFKAFIQKKIKYEKPKDFLHRGLFSKTRFYRNLKTIA
tara:strand:+ start:901 stop:1347 length:447 start_codon:yes stop_codon:yes gene_type:complete